MDVRVRAQTANSFNIENKAGQVEIEENKGGTSDVETFKKSTAKIDWNGIKFGLKEFTFVGFEKSKVVLYNGSAFVTNESGDDFKIATKFGDILNSSKSTFVISANEEKVTISVLSGTVKVDGRLGTEPKTIKGGYQLWLGGVKSSGTRAQGILEAISYEDASHDLKEFGNIQPSDLSVRLDFLKSTWKKAVDDIAEQSQDHVVGDMKLLEEWNMENQKRSAASLKAKSDLKRRFRAHALDLPDQNTEDPSE